MSRVYKLRFEDIVLDVVVYSVLGVLVVLTVYPFVNLLAVSFNDSQDSLKGGIYLWPRVATLGNYKAIFKDALIFHSFYISVLRTVLSTIFGVFCTTMLAYTISRKDYVLRKFITIAYILTMYISGGLIPGYFTIKWVGLVNNFGVYVIPGLIWAFNLIVVRSYIQELPESIIESCRMDGAGDFTVFIRIILPLCKPVIATIALFISVGNWNSWFDTFLYCSSKPELSTLQYELMKKLQSANSAMASTDASSAYAKGQAGIGSDGVTPTAIRAAMTIVASVPVMIVYPFLQKYFVAGLTIGSVKG